MAREDRVAELIKEEISRIIQQKVKDNRVGFVSVTDVEVTKDLSYAKVYISTFGSETDRIKAIKGLEHAAGFIKRELSKVIKIRKTPELRFLDDISIQRGDRIIRKLRELQKDNVDRPEE